jgi:hypothetical protein
LASKLYHKETPPESGGAGAAVKSAVQMKSVYNRATRFPGVEQMVAQVFNPQLAMFSAGSGALGGRELAKMFTDTAKHPEATAPHTKEQAESAFQSKVRDGTNYLVKTTIEAGLLPQFTAGNRVTAELLATLLDPTETIKPTLLIADCMHEAYFDNRIVSGTTTIRGVVVD